MKILLLEDDHLTAENVADELRRNFSGCTVEHISTECAFRQRFATFAMNPPDVFVFDVMVRWTNPSSHMEPIPDEIRNHGPFRAGLRCQNIVAENDVTKSIPVILYSVLERSDYEHDIKHISPNVIAIAKGQDDRLSAVIRSLSQAAGAPLHHKPAVFVVHGHDDEAKETVARFIEKLGLNAVVLHEQPSVGKTIIEKFEAHSNVAFAVVLLTPDDLARSKSEGGSLRGRARQNVILELGYFAAKLGRRNLCALYKPDVEIPSDFQGVLYIPMDPGGAWRALLAREMKAAGLPINANLIL
jgi:predicted nucleotide-binding protein